MSKILTAFLTFHLQSGTNLQSNTLRLTALGRVFTYKSTH